MNTEQPPTHVQLAIMSREYVVSRAIHAIANLGIADHMSDKPISVHTLAKLTDTIPELLDRVLNFLSAYGLFTKTGTAYALTPLSYPLREDHPCSMKDVFSMVDEAWWQAFSHLETGLKTGSSAFRHQHGTDFFDYMNQNPDTRNRFEKGMNKLSVLDDQTIVQEFNFGKYTSLIDIGSGRDNLSRTIKNHYPHISVSCARLDHDMNAPAIKKICSALPNYDACIFKGNLHDFEEEAIKKILGTCYQNMDPHTSLIIAEQVIPENNLPDTNKTMDIIMMVLVGGRQRSIADWCKLVESTGFKLKETVPTKGIFTLMEFVK